MPQIFGRHTGDDVALFDVVSNYGPRANDRTFSYRHAREDRRVRTDAGTFFDRYRYNDPVLFRLRRSVRIRRSGIFIIRKHHAMADKYIVLDRHSLTKK